MFAAALIPGVLICAALGLLGGGGSVLTVRIFVYVQGFEPKAAMAMSSPSSASRVHSARPAAGAPAT